MLYVYTRRMSRTIWPQAQCAVARPTSPLSLPSWSSDSRPEAHSATVIHGSD